ncbi:Kcna6, partial [Symbiodinium sp. CCMP2456]
KVLVLVSVVSSLLVTTQEPLVDVSTSAVLETCFDVIFVMEFLCRCISSPSKRIYVQDPFNWCDMLAALGLPLRASVGFVLQPLSSLEAPTVQQVLLLLFLPIFRFLKLLRYFESFHLLVDAGKNSIAALPVLFYTMAVITLLSSSAIYLVESRDNIPSLPHSIWLALVTMTTVGYGDYAPKSTGGYFVVATLTGVSVLFLALPVGIIGHVFTACWESRAQVLLMNRVRKCLVKWGYTIKDLKILVEYVDADGDGTLNLPEFIELIRQMRIGLTSDSAVDLFMLFDDDHSGLVDYNEFLRHIFPDQYVEYIQDKQQEDEEMRSSSKRVS